MWCIAFSLGVKTLKTRWKGFRETISPLKALKIIELNVKQLDTEKISVYSSINRVLAENVRSPIDSPPFNRALMDGFAVRSSDVSKATHENPVILRITNTCYAGEKALHPVERGEAVKIMTGSVLPENSDSVIELEEVEEEEGYIKVFKPVRAKYNVGLQGEDFKKGSLIGGKGEIITPLLCAAMSSVGIKTVKVSKRPRVSILVTGSELLNPGEKLQPGKIYDSNTALLKGLAVEYGCEIRFMERRKDEKEGIRGFIIKASEKTDLLIISGGMSAGEKDFLPEILEEEGKIFFHGVSMRPGKPTLLGEINSTVVLGLPGSPAACLFSFLYFGRKIISQLTGWKMKKRIVRAVLTKDVPSKFGTLDFLRVKLKRKPVGLFAEPVRLKGSSLISSFLKSDGIVYIGEDKEGLNKGEIVDVELL